MFYFPFMRERENYKENGVDKNSVYCILNGGNTKEIKPKYDMNFHTTVLLSVAIY